MFRGKRQQPRRQTDQKKEIWPPRREPLIEMTAAPTQTITNTISKSSVLSSACVPQLSITAKAKQNKNGPHKSQFLISLLLLSGPLLQVLIGFITILSFSQILTRSLLIVSQTGSSKVLQLLVSRNFYAGATLIFGTSYCSSILTFPSKSQFQNYIFVFEFSKNLIIHLFSN